MRKFDIVPYEEPDDGAEHESLGKPFRVVAKLRNGRLIRAREQMGFMTCTAAAKAMNVKMQILCRYEAMNESPWGCGSGRRRGNTIGQWKESAIRIAEFYGYSPEELWPDVIKEVRERVAVFEIAEPRAALTDDGIVAMETRDEVRRLLSCLAPREKSIVERRFGLLGDGRETPREEISRDEGVGRQRVTQLVDMAIERLRRVAKREDK